MKKENKVFGIMNVILLMFLMMFVFTANVFADDSESITSSAKNCKVIHRFDELGGTNETEDFIFENSYVCKPRTSVKISGVDFTLVCKEVKVNGVVQETVGDCDITADGTTVEFYYNDISLPSLKIDVKKISKVAKDSMSKIYFKLPDGLSTNDVIWGVNGGSNSGTKIYSTAITSDEPNYDYYVTLVVDFNEPVGKILTISAYTADDEPLCESFNVEVCDKKNIDSVFISGVTKPAAGEHPTIEGIQSSTGTIIKEICWFNENNSEISSFDTFEAGKKYKLNIKMGVTDEYVFPPKEQNIAIYIGDDKFVSYDNGCSIFSSVYCEFNVLYTITKPRKVEVISRYLKDEDDTEYLEHYKEYNLTDQDIFKIPFDYEYDGKKYVLKKMFIDDETVNIDDYVSEGEIICNFKENTSIVLEFAQLFKIIINEKGDTAIGDGEYVAGNIVTINAGTRDGYTFDKWQVNGFELNGKTVVNPTFTMPAKDLEITALWKANKISSGGGSSSSIRYTINFETNGSKSISSQKVEKNEKVKKPSNPVKEGYVFDGWFNDKKLENEYDFNSKVTSSFTLYAKWNIEEKIDSEKIPQAFIKGFVDVNDDAWYASSVKEVTQKDIMKGVSDNEFAPNEKMTRAMFTTILHRIEKEPVAATIATYEDIEDGSFYEKAVNWSNEKEIVVGYNDKEFAPNDFITREQIVTILYRYAKYKNVDVSVGENTNILSYEDAFDISEYAISAMQWACGAGVISGKDGGYLDPKGYTTRAEGARLIVKMLCLIK